VPLTLADWARLQEVLITAFFWAFDSEEPLLVVSMGRFGQSRGAPEGHLSGCQQVSPRDEAVRDLGRLFFELAGRPLRGVMIY
jgi:hypothetical protein